MNARDAFGKTPLMHVGVSLVRRDFGVIQELINAGADLYAQDNEGMTPLMHAIRSWDNVRAIIDLIDKYKDVTTKDHLGKTALLYAAETRKRNLGILLINAGANVNVKDRSGKTALMYAAQSKIEVSDVELLLIVGADASLKDREGNTAYDYALENDRLTGTAVLKKLQEASQ